MRQIDEMHTFISCAYYDRLLSYGKVYEVSIKRSFSKSFSLFTKSKRIFIPKS